MSSFRVGDLSELQIVTQTKSPTLLDQFAMAALTGYLAHYGADATFDVTADSYLVAQAMLKARPQ